MAPSKLLLDSHILVWLINHEKGIGVGTLKFINEAEAVYVSAASVWELNIKTVLGRMNLPADFESLITLSGFVELPITFNHAKAVRAIKLAHVDPFDKMLLAQGLSENLPLVTADKTLLQSKYRTIDARL